MSIRKVTAYSSKIRRRAIKLFETGCGYKLTASKLKIPASTVRDWKRLWLVGEFPVHPKRQYNNLKIVQ